MAIGRKVKILCAAGGTGGHLFPAVAVAEKISELNDGKAEIHFIGRPDKIEAEVTPKLGYKFHPLKMRGLNKLFSLDTLLMPFNIFRNIVRCKQLIRDEKFDAVICTGAYISYPPGMAASQEKVPLILMESNVNPGKSIRMLSAKADLILTSFEESAKFFEKGTASKIKYTGNPVRKKIQDYSTKKNLPAAFDLDPDKFTVLIFGGSLGAKSINTAIEKNIDKLAALDAQYLWQTGKNYDYKGTLPSNFTQVRFIDDMAAAYAAADLVLARSGATTVAELGIVAKPAILVPFPGAANNEQEQNARVMEKKGAAIKIEDKDLLTGLYSKISELIVDKARLRSMQIASASLAKPNAAHDCAREILNFLMK